MRTWKCPFCEHHAVLADAPNGTVRQTHHDFEDGHVEGVHRIFIKTIVCPNYVCRKVYIVATMHKARHTPLGTFEVEPNKKNIWVLAPQGSVKPLPNYIPASLVNDYKEAALICDLSPKASATLARRCLQGMINDFWGVKKHRLVDAINAINSMVPTDTWDAIDSLRKIGNIGAHMETDINLVVDVDPEEAKLLIELIESLFEDWYIARHERLERSKKITQSAQNKKLVQTGQLSAATGQPPSKPPTP